MKFATKEIEAQHLAWRTSYCETRRRMQLARALAEYKIKHCNHGFNCAMCVVDFMIDRAPTALAAIDKDMTAQSGAFVCQLGQRWRLLVGPAVAQRIEAVIADKDYGEYLMPELVAVEPAVEFMVCGGTGPTYDAVAITLVPVDPRGGGRYRPRITVPVAYLLENGVLLS